MDVVTANMDANEAQCILGKNLFNVNGSKEVY